MKPKASSLFRLIRLCLIPSADRPWPSRVLPEERKLGTIGAVHALLKRSGRWLFWQLLRAHKGLILALFNTVLRNCHLQLRPPSSGPATPASSTRKCTLRLYCGAGQGVGGWGRWGSPTSHPLRDFPIFPETRRGLAAGGQGTFRTRFSFSSPQQAAHH